MTRPGFEPVPPWWEGSDKKIFFLILDCEAIGTAATPGPLCLPLLIVKMMIVEKQMECTLAGETEVLGENLPQRHFVHHKIPLD
jgi:hypothetical protein